MNDLRPVRVTFTCSNCGATNELTAAHLHEGTMVHCSRCSTPVAPLGLLGKQTLAERPRDQRQAAASAHTQVAALT